MFEYSADNQKKRAGLNLEPGGLQGLVRDLLSLLTRPLKVNTILNLPLRMEMEWFVQNIISSLLGLCCLQEPITFTPLERCGCLVVLTFHVEGLQGPAFTTFPNGRVSAVDCVLASEGTVT